jgi:hypothetical protein
MKPPVPAKRQQNKPVVASELTDKLFPVDDEQKRAKKEWPHLYGHNQQDQTGNDLCKQGNTIKEKHARLGKKYSESKPS